jgi:exodeoxyribonuclease-1
MPATALTFFWHDYETFGTDPRRDRPAQFAGVRTDAELNEIEPAVTRWCRPPRDRLPEPEACLLTGITPQVCEAQGLPEPDFAAEIEGLLAQPGTVGAGYNSIRFDDEVTRFLFWRNLMDPYAREWRNDCARWDLLDVVRCTWALRPEGIEWPRHTDGEHAGKPSFKLEHLSAANGLAHASAHDALSDVRATIALARLIRRRQPRLWDFTFKLRHKTAVLGELALGRPVLHISGMYPAERGCMAVVWPLATHPVNRNEVIVWDLASDPAELMALDAPAIRRRLFTRSADLPEGESRLPIKTVHINKSPIVIGNLKTLSDARAAQFGIDWPAIHRHAETAGRITQPMAGVWDQVFVRDYPATAVDVEEDLYGGFVGDADRRRLDELRALGRHSPGKLAERSRQGANFSDERLAELVFRWRARHFAATLDAEESTQWQAHCRARLHEGVGGGLTLAAFAERIDALHERVDAADERGQAVLEALVDWATEIAP